MTADPEPAVAELVEDLALAERVAVGAAWPMSKALAYVKHWRQHRAHRHGHPCTTCAVVEWLNPPTVETPGAVI